MALTATAMRKGIAVNFRKNSSAEQGILADTMLHSVQVHNECYAATTKRSTRLVGLKFSGAVALAPPTDCAPVSIAPLLTVLQSPLPPY
ncbi:hypothetical protein ACOMHN_064823 [Nucella lapillus]